MDRQAAGRDAMTSPRILTLALLLSCATNAYAGERFALIVSGASGGPQYAQKHDRWRTSVVAVLREKLRFTDGNVVVLAETAGASIGVATRDQVKTVLEGFRTKLTRDDLLLVVLIGHGTFDGVDAKFNLVGPDLDASEWTSLLSGLPSQVALVNTTAASFPFVERLSGPRRVIMTATDSTAQAYETVFAEFFGMSLQEPSADLDKNGRISLWESFTWTSSQVRTWYEQKGQLSTERPLLDDNADGVGKEAGAPGPDGRAAGLIYLDEEADIEASSDPAVAGLRKRRADLEQKVEELKAQKGSMPPDVYEAELEKLLVELALVSREIRAKS
jgi:hypothetical protein